MIEFTSSVNSIGVKLVLVWPIFRHATASKLSMLSYACKVLSFHRIYYRIACRFIWYTSDVNRYFHIWNHVKYYRILRRKNNVFYFSTAPQCRETYSNRYSIVQCKPRKGLYKKLGTFLPLGWFASAFTSSIVTNGPFGEVRILLCLL